LSLFLLLSLLAMLSLFVMLLLFLMFSLFSMYSLFLVLSLFSQRKMRRLRPKIPPSRARLDPYKVLLRCYLSEFHVTLRFLMFLL
jgi:hypothetical protein